ncbi:putative bifunctional diguanylate cyclase/phosphodiesterase [Jannaschia sp. R86511]|uniref:putative bifunctional diguanylate cyclase/phosphodiesterase n=1 Tax=Jannaschia sp. R86511 TaxID=3093853 RepID=UPI0036D3A4E1
MPVWRLLERRLGVAAWVVLVSGLTVAMVLSGASLTQTPPALLVAVLATFFLLLLGRLALVAAHDRARRTALLVLAAGVTLWAVGSAVLNADGELTGKTFPAPGEGFFLASYLGFAFFLLLDTPRRTRASATVWLETLLVCCGAMSLAGFVLLSPVGSTIGEQGPALFLALLYPVLGVVLGLVVLAQVQLRQRRASRRTLTLAGGFVLLAVADSTFVLNAATTTYVSNTVLELMWGASFALVVGAACAPRLDAVSSPATAPSRHIVLVLAAAVALVVIVFRPAGVGAWYVTLPAVLTLVAAGTRMAMALQEARGAVEARRLSVTDDLTDLPNRRAVMARIQGDMAAGRPLALMLLDLDGFKDINDSLGHAAGDRVLEQVSARLLGQVGAASMVSRLGGDEFAIVAPQDDEVSLLRTAQVIGEALLAPLAVDGLVLSVRCSIGIALREGARDATDLLRQADVAMYEAKTSRSGALVYDPSRDEFSRSRLRQAEDLRRGITQDQLELWYQPQIDAATQRVTAVEALVRWRHPELGLLSPLAFLPDARRCGLMPALTEAVMHQVVRDARRWQAEGFTFTVAFNCAPPELLGGTFLPLLFQAVERAGLPSDRLLVEVTEDSFVNDPEHARVALQRLRAHGVQAAIDDYGTGFSSLAYLRDLPVQELKMDRSFVSTILTDTRSRTIVDSTRQMAHAMGLRLVAEGVEDSSTAAELVALGIDVLQGYHICSPVPMKDVSGWVRRWEASLHDRRADLSYRRRA